MRARRSFLLAISILSILSLGFGPVRLTDGDRPRRPLYRQQILTLHDTPFPDLTAAAVLAVNTTTGTILYARNEHAHRAPASLTKIVTAIVAMERGKMDQVIEMEKGDMTVYSMIGLEATEELTLHDLLYILLIPSDNAASVAIARTLGGGDVNKFVGWMNAKVAEWGLQDTHFTNPHGLDEKDNYTSAYDMALIALRAMQNPMFAHIVGLAEQDIANRRLRTTNEMLTRYPGTVGVKTGTEIEAGECLITLVQRPDGHYLTVVLGSTDRYADSIKLLDYYYGTLSEFTVRLPESAQNRYVDAQGGWHAFGLAESRLHLVDRRLVGTEAYMRIIDNPAAAPAPGEQVGVLRVYLADQFLDEVPLYAR